MTPDPKPLLTTLPGDIPGLLRRGSPLRARGGQTVAVVLYDDRAAYATKGGLNHDAVGAMELDLTDPTGRVHAAWWTFQQRDPPDGWTGFPPPISVEESTVRYLATMGAPMTPEQIDTLARLVLRLAGRTP